MTSIYTKEKNKQTKTNKHWQTNKPRFYAETIFKERWVWNWPRW